MRKYRKMPMSILRYEHTDILINKNDVERLGYSGSYSFDYMINLAKHHNCPILVKNGGGKWYLKGMGKSYDELKVKVDDKEGCMLRPGRSSRNATLYLLKF